ncbi:MAG: glycosyltransferase family 4 protein, partial [bacterium]|nr:glycosyltransferase family 4 protein [bacterium]
HDVTPELYEAKYGRRDLLYRVQVWLEKMTFRTADVAMATNETYKGVACSRGGLSPDDVFVVRNGPDLERFRPVPPVAARKHGKRHLVGYVGTMSVQEGLDILLEAARIIKRQGRDDVYFTCIGGGPGLKELRELKTAMDLDDIFDFTGRVPDQDLLEILSTADVCVNPDKPGAMNDMSTMIKIMEYMALGKPIVQFDLKEGRYSAGDAALYARSDLGASDFAAQILRLLDNPEQRASLGAVGRKRVEERLAWQYSVPNLIAAYRRCLES